MAEDTASRVFVPDPPPEGMDPEMAEWILRQLYRITGTSTETVIRQVEGSAGLDAHIQNKSNPHETTAALAGAVSLGNPDSKSATLTLDGSVGFADLLCKGDPEPLGAPTKGSGIGFVKADDSEVGGMVIFQPDPVNSPESVAIGVGSLDEVVPLYLVSAGMLLDSETIAVSIDGAELGSRMVCTGFTAGGNPILGWEGPPPPAYDDFCENPNDIEIQTGVGTSAWIPICAITTTQQIETNQIAYTFWSLFLDNLSNQTGTVDIAITVDGATPTAPDSTIPVIANMYEQVSGSFTTPTGQVYPIGTTIDFWVRGIGTHPNFSVFALGTVSPSRLDVQVR